MKEKNCPINEKECRKTDCAWFIESNDLDGQKELYGCAVKYLAIAVTMNNAKMSDLKSK